MDRPWSGDLQGSPVGVDRRELFLDRKCNWLPAEVMRLLKIWEIEQLG